MKRTPLRRSGPIRRKPRPVEGRVTPEMWNHVIDRDGGCMAPLLDPRADLCRTLAGDLRPRHWRPFLTFEHVHDEAMAGKRAPSDARHGICLCIHHNDNGWASAHRAEERAYLARLEATGRV